MELELRIRDSHSLKEKRAVLQSILHGARNRFEVAAAETDHQDKWQRAAIGFAYVSNSPSHAYKVMEKVDRFVQSFPEVEVVSATWGLDG